jgi:hypothetical protein
MNRDAKTGTNSETQEYEVKEKRWITPIGQLSTTYYKTKPKKKKKKKKKKN